MNNEIPLPDAIRKGVDPSAPTNFRLMLAKGGLPIGASDRLGVLAILVNDPDEGVKAAAIDGMRELEESFLGKALQDAKPKPMYPPAWMTKRSVNRWGTKPVH